MQRKTKITLAVIIGICVLIAAAIPWTFSVAYLLWAKHSAHKIFNNLTAEERHNLNVTPILITLPLPGAQPEDSYDIRSFRITFPTPDSRKIKRDVRILDYPDFTAWIFPPFQNPDADALARVLHFKDYFDQTAAAYRSRLVDLDAQLDLPSLHRFLILQTTKISISRATRVEQFDRGDFRGFILELGDHHTITTQLNFPALHTNCGITFINRRDLTISQIHLFLAHLQLTPKTPTTNHQPLTTDH